MQKIQLVFKLWFLKKTNLKKKYVISKSVNHKKYRKMGLDQKLTDFPLNPLTLGAKNFWLKRLLNFSISVISESKKLGDLVRPFN